MVPNTVQSAQALTIQDVMDRITTQTDGAVVSTMNATNDGIGLHANGQFIAVLDGSPDGSSYSTTIAGKTLTDLGFTSESEGILLQGDRVLGGMGSVLMETLNGGTGLQGASSMTITDRDGDSVTIDDLDGYATLDVLLNAVNSAMASANVNVAIGLNAERTGLQAVDSTSGFGNLQISGDAAEALGVVVDDAVSSHRGTNLQRKYVDFSTSLEELNYGRGIGHGEFKITDSNGLEATINISSDSRTLYDVINEINSRGLAVEARINAQGDGLLLVDTNTDVPQTAMRVESASGSTARDLGILATASSIGGDIDGSYEKTVDLDRTDTLQEVIAKINGADFDVDASILDTGSGALPYRLVLSSTITGRDGDLVVDTGTTNLGFNELTQARNAKVFIGEGANAVLVESTSNTVEDVLAGITLNLHAAADDPVTVTVSRDQSSIIEAVNQFVTTFNDVIARIREYDAYDTETETRGALLGDPTIARVRADLYRTLQQAAPGIETQYRHLFEVGIRVGSGGTIEFDEARFKDAYETDPEAVENLFAAFESEGTSSEEIAPGVTVNRINISYSTLGFGDLFDQLIDGMTNTVDGTLSTADERFGDLIDSANARIDRIDERLEIKRERLQRQFVAMETVLAQLQAQQGPLGMISQNLLLAQRATS